MTSWVTEVLSCPQCGASVRNEGSYLACLNCATHLAVRDGGCVVVGLSGSNRNQKLEELNGELKWSEEVVPEYDHLAFLSSWIGETDKLIARLLSGRRNNRILDLGAGGCELSWQLASRGAQVCAVELVPAFICSAEVFAADVHFERVMADLELMPFTNAAFDLVICKEVLHHCADLRGVAARLHRILKPGGALVAIEPVPGIYRSAKARAGDAELQHIGIHHHYHSLAAYRHQLSPYFRVGEIDLFNPRKQRRGVPIPRMLQRFLGWTLGDNYLLRFTRTNVPVRIQPLSFIPFPAQLLEGHSFQSTRQRFARELSILKIGNDV